MKTLPQPPQGLVPFDIDQHLNAVNAFIAANETMLYSVNHMMGSELKKADGVRMKFDIVRVQSLVNPEKTNYVILSFGPAVPGMDDIPLSTERQIAGVVGNSLWFSMNGHYFAAQDEMDAKMDGLKSMSNPLKEALKEIRSLLDRKPDTEGEEWKG